MNKLSHSRHPELVSGSAVLWKKMLKQVQHDVLMVLFFSLILLSCKTKRERERTYNKPYHKADTELNAQFFMYHGTNNTSFVYYKLDNTQLLYKKTDSTNYFRARIQVSYKFYPTPDARQILDSGTVYIEDKIAGQPQGRVLSGYIPLTVNDGQNSYLELYILDVNGKKNHTHYIHCDKQTVYTQQSFIFLNQNKEALFSNKIEKGTSIYVSNSRVSFSKARVEFFANDYSLPPPPFSQKEPMLYPSIPDSSFSVSSLNGHDIPLTINRQGVYFIRLDSSNTGGCLLLGVEQNFPKVQSHAQMIAASRFIMSKDDYQKLIDATDKQAAIESFWLGIAGNQDRARELIKRYYNRVQEANSFFTSHIEGWKTDMGMIYIIFGSPNKTYKTVGMETWVYGQEGTPNSVTFRFEKINNPFSENCYKLQRGIQFKDPWYVAVGNWREGRVYLED